MTVRNTLITVMLLAFLVGCGKNGGDDMKEKAKAVMENAKESTHNVWSGQIQTLDKTKGVEKTVMDAAQQQRQAIESDSQ